MVIFNFIISLLIAYEVHKLIRFKMFFKINSLAYEYKSRLKDRMDSVAGKLLIKISGVEFLYLVTLIIGLFTTYWIFFISILILAIIYGTVFRKFKNKNIKKILYMLDILLTLAIFICYIINVYFYELNSIEIINLFIK